MMSPWCLCYTGSVSGREGGGMDGGGGVRQEGKRRV